MTEGGGKDVNSIRALILMNMDPLLNLKGSKTRHKGQQSTLINKTQ